MIEKLKSNKKLTRLLTILLFILLCCNLPSLLFFPLCLKEDLFRPPNTEVLISACKKPVVRGVPGGEVLFVHENLTDKTYLLDLRTGEKRNVPDDPLLLDKGIFLSSELVWLEGSYTKTNTPGYKPHYILNLVSGEKYELLDLNWLPFKNDKFDEKYYTYFQSANHVYIHHSRNSLIAISSNYNQLPTKNVIFSQYSLELGGSSAKGELLEQLMKDLDVDYEIVDFSLDYADIPSPTGKYIVRKDGVYLSETNLTIDTNDSFVNIKGWFYDESGMVIQEPITHLVNNTLLGAYYSIHKPVLKLLLHSP